jgi:hypothetical protein
MSPNAKTSGEYETFENALKTVMSVPRDEMKRREEEYQRARGKERKESSKSKHERKKDGK